jgi:hypothetical protein
MQAHPVRARGKHRLPVAGLELREGFSVRLHERFETLHTRLKHFFALSGKLHMTTELLL